MTEAVKNALANRGKLKDDDLVLKGAATTKNTAAGAGTDSTGALVIDTGGGYTEGVVVVDVNSVQSGATTSDYWISLQGSNNSACGTPIVDWPLLQLGIAAQVRHTRSNVTANTRYIVPFNNDFGGYLYRYLRIYLHVGATPGTTGIDYEAFLSV